MGGCHTAVMPRRPRLHSTDLRGAARLATDAARGLTDLVEAMHERIARLPGVPARSPAGRTRGITGLVYKSVRGVTRLTGGTVDALLALLAPALPANDDPGTPGPDREAIVAALNGVLGDHLLASANPLATPMAFHRDGRALPLARAALAQRLPDAGPRLLVLLHGLCMNDLQWSREGHDHGAALARESGYTPIYLRYNSGLHVSTNGQALAQQLEALLDAWPVALGRCVLLGHSMGGLLARSALHHGARAGMRWPTRVTDLVCLGTPHHGAPLERAGHWVDLLLGATPYAAPLARLGRLRSAGITDLRHGNLVDDDWAGNDRFGRLADRRLAVPLPDTVRCHTLAASIGQGGSELKDRLLDHGLGDGLVPLASALGHHPDPARCLAFAAQRQWVGYGINHVGLLDHAEVFAQLRHWLR